MSILRLAVVVLLVAGPACIPKETTPPDHAAPVAAREIPSPAAPGSGEPNLTTAPDGRVFLSWIEPAGEKKHALRFSVRRRGGAWSPPTTAAEGTGWFVNWADFPSLAVLPNGALFAHWLAKSGPDTYAYDVRMAISRDGGRTWSPSIVPHRDGTRTEHGFVSLVPWSGDQLAVVWLDGRKTAGAAKDRGGHGGAQAEMSLLYTTVTADGRLGAETVLDGRVCDCCQTSAARTERGLVVVYRDRSEREVRDISTVRYEDGRWSAPQGIGADGWQIDGCPVNGPAVAADRRRVAVAWFTAPKETARVSVVFSNDAGTTYGAPIVVDDGRPIGRVDVALLPGGDALVSWMEQAAAGVDLRVRRVGAAGERGSAIRVADSSAARSSGFPRMKLAAGEIVMAWRDAADPPRVRTAVVDLGGR